jgi:hypothetical protein
MPAKQSKSSSDHLSAGHRQLEVESGNAGEVTAKLWRIHQQMLFEESAIDPKVAAERGYETVTRRSRLEEFKKYQRRASADKPALLVPLYSPDGITRLSQLRPHTPRVPGLKYETPGGAGLIIDVHPRMRERVRHGLEPLLITEGAKTGDAVTSRDIPTVVLPGVNAWNVPKVKPKRLRPCFDHIRLKGRKVFICFDSDCMTKQEVQQALAGLVACLEDRGAIVRVIYLPDAADGSKQGIDDYLAAGGTIKEMFMLARKFDSADFGEIRLSRDERLHDAIRHLWQRWLDDDWMHFTGNADKGNWARGHSARDVVEALLETAAKSGKLKEDAIEVKISMRGLAQRAAKSLGSVRKSLQHLAADGWLEILPPKDQKSSRTYRLLVGRARVYSMEGREAQREASNSQSQSVRSLCIPLRAPSAPRLRWSTPVRQRRREFELVPGRAVVRRTGAPSVDEQADMPTYKRLCPHRGAIVDQLEAHDGRLDVLDLMEALGRSNSRKRDFKRRILKRLEEAGIVERDGDTVSLAPDWLDRLNERREADGEIELAERLAKRYRTESERYRTHLEREKNGTPQASLDAVRRSRELRERRLQEMREEEERDRGPTPPEIEDLIKSALRRNKRVRLNLIAEMALGAGLRWRAVRPAIERLGYRVERLPEFFNEEFVYRPTSAGLVDSGTLEPEHEQLDLVTSEATPDASREPRHALDCKCLDCSVPAPRYARPYRGVA